MRPRSQPCAGQGVATPLGPAAGDAGVTLGVGVGVADGVGLGDDEGSAVALLEGSAEGVALGLALLLGVGLALGPALVGDVGFDDGAGFPPSPGRWSCHLHPRARARWRARSR